MYGETYQSVRVRVTHGCDELEWLLDEELSLDRDDKSGQPFFRRLLTHVRTGATAFELKPYEVSRLREFVAEARYSEAETYSATELADLHVSARRRNRIHLLDSIADQIPGGYLGL